MLTNVDKTVELFNEALDKTGNSYLYFELAYTNYTGWMCWLQDRTGGEKCKKNLCPPGQADEPGVACVPVKQYLEAWKRNGWTPRNVPPLEANKEHPFDGKWVIPKQLDDIIKAQADAEALKKVEAIIGDLDKTNGQNRTCDEIAKQKVAKHYGIMFRYFRAHYVLKKLDEFAQTFPGYKGTVEEAIAFMDHKDLDGYFRTKLAEVTQVEPDAEQDPEIQSILDLKLPPLDSYVEILYQKTFKTRSRNHKAMMASLCGLSRDDGFLHGGRGKRRKYVLGNQLLELLVQLAVVGFRKGKFITEPITVSGFVEWLRQRYGILIDTTGEQSDSPEVARALEANYTALKDRLRQLGFFTDLSDASISQVIKPRFPITADPV